MGLPLVSNKIYAIELRLRSYYSAVQPAGTVPRRETCSNLLGCPKQPNRSQPLVGRHSPYRDDIWRRYCCLKLFFLIVDTCLICEDIARQSCAMVLDCHLWRFFVSCIFSEPHAARFRPASYIRTKATPCVEVWCRSNLRRLRLSEEKRRRWKKPQGKNIMTASVTQGGPGRQ